MRELRTPLKQVRGVGSARAGTGHFVMQRLTAIALVPLTLWFVWLALTLLHVDYAAARTLLAQPLHTVLMAAFVIAGFWHAQLGVQVVIEDYVHRPGLEVALQIALKFATILGALVSLFAIARVALAS